MGVIKFKDKYQKEIDGTFRSLQGHHSRWTIWADFITMSACTLALLDQKRREQNLTLYRDTAKKYQLEELEKFKRMFSIVVEALEDNPEQDFLGDLFMMLELSNDHGGQFFTPYHLCRLTAEITAIDAKADVERNGWIGVNDPACGAGALLIAFANQAKKAGINYQENVEYTAQDIDSTAAMMCYIELSLLGLAGYVIIGNTLKKPPTENLSDYNVLYTPAYFTEDWHIRRLIRQIRDIELRGVIDERNVMP